MSPAHHSTRGYTMNCTLPGAIAFVLLVTVYALVLMALATVLPIVFLISLAAWLIVRRPIANPSRIQEDVRRFASVAAAVLSRLFEFLVRPLAHPL